MPLGQGVVRVIENGADRQIMYNFIGLPFDVAYLEIQDSRLNPHRLGLIKDLEKVQMRATKLVITIKNLTYKDRLKRLKLPTLKYRCISFA